MAKLNGRHGGRDALIEALAGQLAVHARAVRVDVAEMIRSAMRAGGYHGDYLDASHVVGVLPPTVGGLPPTGALELVDGAGVGLLDELGLVLVDDATFAAADHTHATVGTPDPHHATHEPGGSDPMAVDAVAATGSLRTLGTGANQAAPGNDARFGSGGPPTGAASGHLSGTYPGPSIAPLVVTDAMVVAANKDGTTTTPSLRTIGTGATQAAAGNHTHGAAAPAAHATTHQPGGSDAMAVDAVATTGSLRTLGTSATSAAAGNDGRLSDARTPTAHATTHQPGGSDPLAVDAPAGTASLRTLSTTATSAAAGNHTHGAAAPAAHATTHQPGGTDAMAVDAAAATGSLRTLGTGAQQATAGNDARLGDSRPPTGTAGGDLSGTYPSPQIAAGVVTDLDVNAANKDGVAGTASMRTLGTGATQAAAGNHAHATYVTNPMTSVADLIVGGTAGAPTRLGVGAATQVLTVVGGVLTWATPASGGMTNPMTSVGDLIAGGASGAPGRLGVGATDQVLSVVAGAPAWASPIATDNLLTNPGLETWQRGAGPFTGAAPAGYGADRWQNDVGGGSIFSVSRDSANADAGSQYCAAVTFTYNAESGFRQDLEHYVQLRGRTLTLAIRVKTSTANAVRASLYDSVNGLRYSAYHTGGGAYETLTITAPIAAATTSVRAALRLTVSCTAYLDNATLVVGSAALAYAPLHPADEMSRCLRYYEVHGGGLAMGPIIQGYGAAGASAGYGLIFAARKAVTPTMTKNGTWTATNCSQPALNFPTFASYEFATNITALGTIGSWAADATCTVVAESNP